MKSQITTAYILDTRRKKLDKTYPVKLRVTYQRKARFFGLQWKDKTPISMTKAQFKLMNDSHSRGTARDNRQHIESEENRAQKIIDSLQPFTFEAFERKFFDKNEAGDVLGMYRKIIADKRAAGRIGTAVTYECSLSSIIRFLYPEIGKLKKEERVAKEATLTLPFEQLTVAKLNEYKAHMSKQGISDASQGIYLRCLRAVFADAVKQGIVKGHYYPFGKDKIEIPQGSKRLIALTKDELKKIYNATVNDKDEIEGYCRDMFILSYSINGANLKDILRLKYSDIDRNIVTFIRSKTEHTRKKSKAVISCVLTPEALTIIERWGIKPIRPGNRIFDVLPDGITPEQEYKRTQNFIRLVNKYVQRIANRCEINKNVTTYTARHSYASTAIIEGLPVAYISQDLGHADLNTTMFYIERLETEEIKQARGRMSLTDASQ